jgi:uncharacterized phage protein gp47/JayE
MGDVYGVTDAGFVVKPLDVVIEEQKALARSLFGEGINTEAPSKLGQYIGATSERESEVWDLAQASYSARDPDQAQGASLEILSGITGAYRDAARRSTVVATLGGVAGTVIPLGKVASVTGTGVRFRTLAEATVGGGGTVLVSMEAEVTGPLPAPAGTLTVIETPVAGWTTVTNAADATLGAAAMTDPALRVKRVLTLAKSGSATLAAIVAEVATVADVTTVLGFENDTAGVVDGMPAHSIEILVQGGDQDLIAAAIWRSKSAGIQSHGTTTVVVVDAAGVSHDVKFTRPTAKNVYIVVGLSKDATYPVDGDAQVKAALVAYGAAHYVVGGDVYARTLIAPVLSIAGVYNVPQMFIGLAPAPGTEATIVIGSRELAVLDTARITVGYV